MALCLWLPAGNTLAQAGQSQTSVVPTSGDWYLKAAVGPKFIEGVSIAGVPELSSNATNSEETVVVGAGYYLNEKWRLELSFENLLSAQQSLNPNTNLRSRAITGEVFREFGEIAGVTPYVGVGVGYSDVKLDIEQASAPFTGEDSGFIWTVTPGLSFDVSENFSLSSWLQFQKHPSYEFGEVQVDGSSQTLLMTGLKFRWGHQSRAGEDSGVSEACFAQTPREISKNPFKISEGGSLYISGADLLPDAGLACQKRIRVNIDDMREANLDGKVIDLDNAFEIRIKSTPKHYHGSTKFSYSVDDSKAEVNVFFESKNSKPRAQDVELGNIVLDDNGQILIPIEQLIKTVTDNDLEPFGPGLPPGDAIFLAGTVLGAEINSEEKNDEFDGTLKCADPSDATCKGDGTNIILKCKKEFECVGIRHKFDYIVSDTAGATDQETVYFSILPTPIAAIENEGLCNPPPTDPICRKTEHLNMVFFKSGFPQLNENEEVNSFSLKNKADEDVTSAVISDLINELENLNDTCGITDIRIFGHADGAGSERVNNKMSFIRAAYIKQKLLENDTLTALEARIKKPIGRGDTVRLVEIGSQEPLNRRAEIFTTTCSTTSIE